MKSVQIQLTTECNHRCYMCRKYTWPQAEMPLKTLRAKLEKYKNCTITFSGGDPLSYTFIDEVNKIIKEFGISYQVFTNLDYDLDEHRMEFLMGAEFIQVSCDGNGAAAYYSVRRPLEKNFERFNNNINMLIVKKHDALKVNMTVSKRNYFEAMDVAEFFANQFVKVRLFPVHTDENAKLEPYMYTYIKQQFSECEIIGTVCKYSNIEDFLNNSAGKRSEPYNGPCYVKMHHRVIDEFGNEFTCCRAINDNGEDWGNRYNVNNLSGLSNENVLYPYCDGCDRYVKFNKHPELLDAEKIYL